MKFQGRRRRNHPEIGELGRTAGKWNYGKQPQELLWGMRGFHCGFGGSEGVLRRAGRKRQNYGGIPQQIFQTDGLPPGASGIRDAGQKEPEVRVKLCMFEDRKQSKRFLEKAWDIKSFADDARIQLSLSFLS
mgnify:CR=1 FL=1